MKTILTANDQSADTTSRGTHTRAKQMSMRCAVPEGECIRQPHSFSVAITSLEQVNRRTYSASIRWEFASIAPYQVGVALLLRANWSHVIQWIARELDLRPSAAFAHAPLSVRGVAIKYKVKILTDCLTRSSICEHEAISKLWTGTRGLTKSIVIAGG